MKSKLVWIAIILALGAFMVNSHLKKKFEREAQEAEASRMQQEVKAALAKISLRHNAVIDWEKQLSKGESYRLSPILTIELEKLWQGERPILFIGSIKDISSDGTGAYRVLLEQVLFNVDYLFSTELRLSLNVPKDVLDSFLQQYPKVLATDGINSGVAVIAQIYSISTSEEGDEAGERVEVKTGQGRLLEIVYTDDVFF